MKVVLRRVILALVGGSLLAVAAAVLVLALALALFAALRPWIGPSGAALGVAAGAALIMALAWLWLDRCLLAPGRGKAGDEPDLIQKLLAMAQERPILSAGALIGAIFLALRNPTLTAALVKAFLEPAARPGKKG